MAKSDVTKVHEALEKAGLNPQDWEVSFEQKIVVRKARTELNIETVMPPFPKLEPCAPKAWENREEVCPRCDAKLSGHRRVDYLVQPSHVQQIFEFFTQLQNKHDATKSMYFKLATEAGSNVLTQKEMVLLLKDLALQNPALTNEFTRLYAYYIPAESFHYEINNLTKALLTLIIQFKALNDKYVLEYHLDRNLMPKATEADFMEHFKKTHERTAILDYDGIQTRMYEVAAKVLAYEKLAAKFSELPRYAKLKKSLGRRGERQQIVIPTYPYGLRPSSRRREVPYE